MRYFYSVFDEYGKFYNYYSSAQKPSLYLLSEDARLKDFVLLQDMRVPLPDDAAHLGSGPFVRGAVATSGTKPVIFNPANFAMTIVNFVVISNVVMWINSLWNKK